MRDKTYSSLVFIYNNIIYLCLCVCLLIYAPARVCVCNIIMCSVRAARERARSWFNELVAPRRQRPTAGHGYTPRVS